MHRQFYSFFTYRWLFTIAVIICTIAFTIEAIECQIRRETDGYNAKSVTYDRCHDIVDHLSDVLQRAVIIEDKNFELVAYSSPDELSFDALQQKSILTKRCPLFVIERL